MRHGQNRTGTTAAAILLAVTLGAGALAPAHAQSGPSDQDRHFLEEIAQDSNFEIKTSQLALQKSQSADVKQYATMVVRDHTRLKQQISATETAAQVKPVSAGSLSVGDRATVAKLELLSGDAFDKAYIKELVKGNDQILNDEKSEASGSSLASIKSLAERSATLDTKHAEKAKQLAQAHNIQP